MHSSLVNNFYAINKFKIYQMPHLIKWYLLPALTYAYTFITVWKSISASGAPDSSSLSHFSAMTRPCWLKRAAMDYNATPSSRCRVDGVEVDAANAP